ncbi:hypothetical protein XENORESO_004078 [Xenotaenia resolanae]|uniref:Uncharacterized protein n=1 Tax=Xenotaenia resolanae TaxID=208358 RepID=A0ABV0X0R8_9TELE
MELSLSDQLLEKNTIPKNVLLNTVANSCTHRKETKANTNFTLLNPALLSVIYQGTHLSLSEELVVYYICCSLELMIQNCPVLQHLEVMVCVSQACTKANMACG